MEARLHIRIISLSALLICGAAADGNARILCKTPNGETTHCISLYSCPILLKALGSLQPSSLEFVRQSQCGIRDDFLVCCGSSSLFLNQHEATLGPSKNRTNDEDNEPPIWIWTGSPGHKLVDYLAVENILPDKQSCGLQDAKTGEDFPWMALLKKQTPDGKKIIVCSGALISPRHVLTVVECLSPNITVLLGHRHCLEDPECNRGSMDVEIEEEYIHPKYDIALKLYNIALLRLSQHISSSDYIKPICLPFEGYRAPREGQEVATSGWATTLQGTLEKLKEKAKFSLISNENCQKMQGNLQISDSLFCIEEVLKDNVCFGDAGGPIMHSYKNQWFLEGVITVSGSCNSDLPIVGIRISDFMEWILDNIRE